MKDVDYDAMHADAMASLDAIEEIQRSVPQLTGNMRRLASFAAMGRGGDKKKPKLDKEDRKKMAIAVLKK